MIAILAVLLLGCEVPQECPDPECSASCYEVVRDLFIDRDGPGPEPRIPITVNSTIPLDWWVYERLTIRTTGATKHGEICCSCWGGPVNVFNMGEKWDRPVDESEIGLFDSANPFEVEVLLGVANASALGSDGKFRCKSYHGRVAGVPELAGEEKAWKLDDDPHEAFSSLADYSFALRTCTGDIPDAMGVRDSVVDWQDHLRLVSKWGPCEFPLQCPEDLDEDGDVDFVDLSILLDAWGECPGP